MRPGSTGRAIRRARIGIAAVLPLLGSCAGHEVAPAPAHAAAPSDEVSNCRALLRHDAMAVSPELDAGSIRLVSWNVQKNSHLDWERDFHALTGDSDLVLVQELSLREDSINAFDGSRHWSFAPGYLKSGSISGVLTMSRSKPIAQCSFVNVEPLLRTPKATIITEYGLTTTDATLVVVNIHAVNFSMGLGAFARQFAQVREVLEAHDGPIIVSGDFNTWREQRIETVAEMAAALGLAPLAFDEDYRVTMFGKPLDHIYVRGLLPLDATTARVKSSDHNPLSATLRL